ncbi:Aldo/keto reductase [Dichomitus squalens LYAD-421 SS1]|uniref:Aldo/keto reductase n=1 Tax=Dichomitus squalens (strain LYAD-421) TaxID=732165 RepID=R7SL40_DICSQ|nr:Aldo/keto reductase [Dichomitus squalens LYAD-421 SS1]EJF55737.1 Aldo/keto reductase [Dichomitus squalens LYAD-421 SS1]
MAADIPSFTLNTGYKMPSVGIGVWLGPDGGGEVAEQMCKTALQLGYRHIDTAYGYANEEQVGKAIRESGVPREEIFLTTKLPNHHHHRVAESLQESLDKLGVDYVDLYLIHWPQAYTEDNKTISYDESPTYIDTWRDMERLLGTGKVRSIGVSNFSVKLLEVLLKETTVVPATNQVECHPCLPSFELKKYCDEKGIVLTAYSPLGRPKEYDGKPVFLEDPDIVRIAQAHNSTPGQVALSWGVQRGTVVIPKSENPERIKQNISLIKLADEDMLAIDAIHKKAGMHRSLLRYHKNSSDGRIFGWTYEQLGWNMKQGGIALE